MWASLEIFCFLVGIAESYNCCCSCCTNGCRHNNSRLCSGSFFLTTCWSFLCKLLTVIRYGSCKYREVGFCLFGFRSLYEDFCMLSPIYYFPMHSLKHQHSDINIHFCARVQLGKIEQEPSKLCRCGLSFFLKVHVYTWSCVTNPKETSLLSVRSFLSALICWLILSAFTGHQIFLRWAGAVNFSLARVMTHRGINFVFSLHCFMSALVCPFHGQANKVSCTGRLQEILDDFYHFCGVIFLQSHYIVSSALALIIH